MFTPPEGALGSDVLHLYAFVLEKTRQHFIYYNFYEQEMLVNSLDDTDQTGKIFMHGPVVLGQLASNGRWLGYNQCIIKQREYVCREAFVHNLKILDSLFHEILYIENYVLKISACALETRDAEELHYLLGALSVNHILVASESCRSDVTTFEFLSWNSEGAQYIFCSGSWNDNTKFTCTIAMLKLVLLAEKKSEKFPLPQAPLLHVVVPLTAQQKMIALTLAQILQKHGCATDVYEQSVSFDEHTHKARLSGARYVVAIGPEEQTDGTVRINDLKKQTSTVVAHDDIFTFLGVNVR